MSEEKPIKKSRNITPTQLKLLDDFGARFVIFLLVLVIVLQGMVLWRTQQLLSDAQNAARLRATGNVAVDYSAQRYTRAHVASYTRWRCVYNLWLRESGWNKYARNPTSGAYGIPQSLPASKMASAGSDWRTNGITQVKWGLRYIRNRYGNTCNAWGHWQRYNWY